MKASVQRLSELMRSADIRPLGPLTADPEISGTCLDSRRVQAGDLFFAIQGFTANGERFVPEAIERGARAVVAASPRPDAIDARIAWVQVERPRQAAGLLSREVYGRPDESLTLVGITGTNGKTTVAYMVEAIARAAGRRTGRIGTVGLAIGGEGHALERTTPEAPDFYRLLAKMRDQAIDLVAAEVSSHALALSRVEGARFATAAFLNLGRDHLDFHRDEAAYFEAKAMLFESLGPRQHAVLPADSDHGAELRRRTRGKVWTFGRSASADVRLEEERCTIDGSSAVLETPSGTLPFSCRLAGRFNLDNAAAAAACGLAVGLPPHAVPSGLAALQRVPGRMERVDRGQPFALFVDYAHTADALNSLLSWLRELAQGRLSVVFGCGGGRDRGKRFPMGQVAARYADRIFLTSDNPRHEDPRLILDEIGEGVRSVDGAMERCRIIPSREEAIRIAVGAAEPSDVLVVAGKGHETTQDLGMRVEPFDDRVVAIHALAELGWDGKRVAGA